MALECRQHDQLNSKEMKSQNSGSSQPEKNLCMIEVQIPRYPKDGTHQDEIIQEGDENFKETTTVI